VKEAPSNNKPPVEVTETEDVTISNTDSGIGSLSQNARDRAQLMFERDREKRRLRLAGKDPESSKIIEDIDKKLKLNPNVGIVPSRSWATRKQPDFVKRLKGDYPPALTQREKYQGAETITDPDNYASDLYTAFKETKPGEEIKVTETEVDGSPSDGYLISEAMEGPDSWREIIEGGDDPKGPYGPAKESGNALKKEVEDLGFKLPLTNTQLVSMGLALMSGREEGLATAAKVIASQKSADELDAIIKKAQMENKAKLAEHLRKARKDRIDAWNDAKGSAMKQAELIQKVRSQSVDQGIKTLNLMPETQKMALFNQVGADGEELTPSERSKLAIKKIKAMVQATAENIQSGE
jgi:hypothetical protein